MKSIVTYINEGRNISIEIVKNHKYAYLINHGASDLINEVKDDPQEDEYPLDEPTLCGERLLVDLINFISDAEYTYRIWHVNKKDVPNILKDAGVTEEYLFEWFNDWINSGARISKNIKKSFGIGAKINKEISDSTRNKYKEHIDELGVNPEQIDNNDVERAYDKDDKVIWAVRTKNGDKDCVFYATPKDADNYSARHAVRYMYAFDMDYNYYLVRELTYKEWLKKDDEHKYATNP